MVKETYCLNAESKSEVESKITITFDPLGVFTASKENEFSDEEQEPAWNFRLWGSSVQLSRHLEVLLKDSSITPDCLIELGSGTGLPSIVAHKLGISHVIASDLPRAMPLLYYNLIENIAPNSQHESHSFVMPTNRDLCCPSGHLLQDEHVFSDEFMCSVCGEDIEENVFVKRCQRCNFDLCHENCLAAISRGGLEDLPLWFQTELRFRSQFGLPDMNTYHHEFPDVSVDSLSRKGSVSLLSFDWMNDASRIQLQRTIQSKACSSVFIVGADISYSPQSVDIIMSMLPKLVSDMRMSGVQVRILLMHQVRSMLTTSKLLHALAAANWRIERRLIEVSSNTSSLGDLQESEESSIDMSLGGDMAVVQNGIYLIDVIVD